MWCFYCDEIVIAQLRRSIYSTMPKILALEPSSTKYWERMTRNLHVWALIKAVWLVGGHDRTVVSAQKFTFASSDTALAPALLPHYRCSNAIYLPSDIITYRCHPICCHLETPQALPDRLTILENMTSGRIPRKGPCFPLDWGG